MKILVISDTHGNFSLAMTAHRLAEPVEAVIHLGDGCADADLIRAVLDVPVFTVAGNCDFRSSAPREYLWECEGKRILLVHGDAYRVKAGLEFLEQRARALNADAVLFGHTHEAVQEIHTELLILNPGTLAHASCHRSYAVLNVEPDSISARIYELD